MQPKLYSIKELVSILKLHEKTILRFIREGKLGARKVGRTWMVQEDTLKEYLQGDASEPQVKAEALNEQSFANRIRVSAVIEVTEHASEEATRISNSLLALLNGHDESFSKARFDFLYYPEIRKAKYLLYGSPKFISSVLEEFAMLCQQEGEADD